MGDWVVPGYDLQELLGFGGAGEVWRARQRSSGATVALRRVAGGDRELLARIRAAATVVRSLPTPHLVRLRTTTRAGREDALVLDHADGGSLEALLARRRRVEPGEVVTVVAPLAEALAQAHAHDLVHGRVRASSVLLTADGRPLLDGLGLTCLHDADDTLDPTGALGAAADVWALGALGHRLLTGDEPGETPLAELAPAAPLPLVRAIEAALAFDPAERPAAHDLAAALLVACPARPLSGLQPAEQEPDPSKLRGQALALRRVLLAGVGAVVLAAVVAGGWAWGHHGSAQAARVPVTSAPTPMTDWSAVLGQLDEVRATAFARADAALLDRVYVEGSQLLVADRQALSGWGPLRRTAEGVRHRVQSVQLVSEGRDAVVLRVRESLGAYVVRTGTVRERHPGGGPVERVVVLVATPEGWRIAQVRAA